MLMHSKIFTYNDPLPLPIKLSLVTLVPIPLNLPMIFSSPVAIFLPQLFQASSAQEAEMSADRAKPGSRPGTDWLFGISDRVQVTTIVTLSQGSHSLWSSIRSWRCDVGSLGLRDLHCELKETTRCEVKIYPTSDRPLSPIRWLLGLTGLAGLSVIHDKPEPLSVRVRVTILKSKPDPRSPKLHYRSS